jgi:ADP-ribose pyrophosphatase YjhB (NUDIX family)
MDVAAFAIMAAVATAAALKRQKCDSGSDTGTSLYYVTKDNEDIASSSNDNSLVVDPHDLWHRATYVLVMHDPPDMFYEPKEWSHTTVLLCRIKDKDGKEKLILPGGPLRAGESYVNCAVRKLRDTTGIDVLQPENCLHHLFTFPYDSDQVRQWSNFMECVFRGEMEDLKGCGKDFVRMSLEELKDKVIAEQDAFEDETYYAVRLYFQRQMDLRAKRRLLKGYSSSDLEKYGLRPEQKIVFRADDEDSERSGALDYTMKTDDGMSPRLLQAADVVLLGVSRAGKTPLSLLLSQTKGIKVANIPLVLEVPPPRQLFQVDPRRVFCITQQAEHLEHVRKNRLRRELKKKVGPRSTYADPEYVRRDLDNAKELSREHGYTIIDITDRAMEEAASLIMSKLKERFPDSDFGDLAME